MKVIVLGESGYAETLLGLGLSYGLTSSETIEEFLADGVLFSKMERVARKLFDKDTGENKFLESMAVWLDIDAPRFWWQQFTTYRIGISAQSESTMHTLLRRPLEQEDFEFPLPEDILDRLDDLVEDKRFTILKNELPEGYLQRRIICTNYKALRHIVSQRHDHKLPQWQVFCQAVIDQVEHPEFLT